ncbi:MAG TPA: polysaccharide biosynthesis/export family protein, partial [Polyangiaceae bacterium]
FFKDDKVAINDIGAVAYFGDEKMVDLVGLASLPVAKAKGLRLEQPLTRAQIEELTQGVAVAIVYDEWFPDLLPSTWLRVGRWHIDDCKSPAFPDVSIYATTDESVPRVIAALREFSKALPAGVHQEGRYTETPDGLAGDPKIGAGTTVMLTVEGSAEITSVYTVKPDGSIYPPKLGALKVRGLTAGDADAVVRGAIDKQKDKKLSAGSPGVRILEGGGTHLYVAGKVQKTGDLRGAASEVFTVGRVIHLSGGLAPGANVAAIGVWREHGGSLERVPVVSMDAALQNYDIVVVP